MNLSSRLALVRIHLSLKQDKSQLLDQPYRISASIAVGSSRISKRVAGVERLYLDVSDTAEFLCIAQRINTKGLFLGYRRMGQACCLSSREFAFVVNAEVRDTSSTI